MSVLFVLYGFYLLFLFIWDTMIRVNERTALPVAVTLTLAVMLVSGILWVRKHIKQIQPILMRK